MKHMYGVGGLAALLLAVISSPVMASLSAAKTQRPFQVVLVTDAAGLGDHAFNDLAWRGIRQTITQYHVRGMVLESRSTDDYVPRLIEAVKRRPDLIVAVGATMASAVYQIGTRYPRQRYVLVDATPVRGRGRPVVMANVANLWFREQEAGFLAGVLAGWMERARVGKARHHTVGYLGSFPTVGVDHYLAGYLAAVRAVDRGITVLGGYSHSASDQGKARTIGLAQVAQGADILFGVAGVSSRSYLEAARSKGVYGIGSDSDRASLGSYILTSAVKRVDVAVRLTIRRGMTHRFQGGDHFFGLKEGAVGLASPARVVPSWLRSRLVADEKLIAKGRIVPPMAMPSP